jgi:hypothetical protein
MRHCVDIWIVKTTHWNMDGIRWVFNKG